MTSDGRGQACNYEKQLAIAESYADSVPAHMTRSQLVDAFLRCYRHGERNRQIRDAARARTQRRREPAA